MEKEKKNEVTLVRIFTSSNVRYEGEMMEINRVTKTITLKDVRCFGTEDRETDNKIEKVDSVFEYIKFESKDIKDLVVLKKYVPKTKENISRKNSSNQNEKTKKQSPLKEETNEKVVIDKKTKDQKQNLPKENKKSKPISKVENDEVDYSDLIKQTENWKLENKKEENSENDLKYKQNDFFDNITVVSTREANKNYNIIKTNQDTFDISKKEIYDTKKDIANFKNKKNNNGYNQKGRGGKRRNNNNNKTNNYKNKDSNDNEEFLKNQNKKKKKNKPEYEYVPKHLLKDK